MFFLCHVISFWQFLDYFPVVYIRQQDFSLIQRESSSVEIVKRSKKALFCDDCRDRNQAIILVVLVSL